MGRRSSLLAVPIRDSVALKCGAKKSKDSHLSLTVTAIGAAVDDVPEYPHAILILVKDIRIATKSQVSSPSIVGRSTLLTVSSAAPPPSHCV